MNKFQFRFIWLILCLIGASGCFVSNRKEVVEISNQNAAAGSTSENSKTESAGIGGKALNEIRKIDFKNFTYEPYCAGEDAAKITVKKGEYALDKSDFDRLYFNVMDVAYGDLNGDESEEAIITTVCNTGGTGQFTEGFVYRMTDGKPELLTRIAGGDRADGGLRTAKADGGLLVVERNGAGENSGACCPEFVVTSKYKLDGKKLKQIGGDATRELYPPQRVKFERGASAATVNIKLSNDDDIKRFSVGAQAGQLLSVWSDSKDVSITLVKGAADVVKDGENLEANLQSSGDFVFQVQKIGDKNISLALGIEIR